MEVKAVTEALLFLATSAYNKAVIATDSMSTLQKIQRGMLHSDWIDQFLCGEVVKTPDWEPEGPRIASCLSVHRKVVGVYSFRSKLRVISGKYVSF